MKQEKNLSLNKNSPLITTYLSNKLKAISFICMVMIVFLHSSTTIFNFNTGSVHKSNKANVFVQTIVGEGFTRVAVPFFFAISGFLFFQNIQPTANSFLTKLKKRVQSVFLPYILWSLYSLLLFAFLQYFSFTKDFFATRLIRNYSAWDLFYTVFFNPLAYQLWFLKDLILIFLLSPAIYFCIRKLSIFYLLFILACWLFNFYFYYFQAISICFFSLGAFVSLNPTIKFKTSYTEYAWLLFFIWILLCVLVAVIRVFYGNPPVNFYVQCISIFVGMATFWLMYDERMKGGNPSKKWLSIFSYSFFIYAFHEPVLTIIKKGLFYLSDKSNTSTFLIFIISPCTTILLAISIGILLNKLVPALYRLITGGR